MLEECGLCGHVQGDPRAVAVLHEQRAAEELGISVELLGLLDALEAIPGVVVERSLSQVPADLAPPAIFFQLRERALEVLDRLTRSLVLARRRLHHLWIRRIGYGSLASVTSVLELAHLNHGSNKFNLHLGAIRRILIAPPDSQHVLTGALYQVGSST